MHFYKVIWQYLWGHKPEDLFNGENAFIVDGHFFFPQIVETLKQPPHIADFEDVLTESVDMRNIVSKSLEVLTIFTEEQEFMEFFANNGTDVYLRIILPFLKVT